MAAIVVGVVVLVFIFVVPVTLVVIIIETCARVTRGSRTSVFVCVFFIIGTAANSASLIIGLGIVIRRPVPRSVCPFRSSA